MINVDSTCRIEDIQRIRVEKMERQLANLTGIVHKALNVPEEPTAAPRQEFPSIYQSRTPGQGNYNIHYCSVTEINATYEMSLIN